jgi:multiple sugar transport system ATP-binding protein
MANVELRSVSKAFGTSPVLRNIDLKVQDGEFLVLVGPSGCGKSTLLRSIAGLDEVDSGDILIGGERMNGVPPAKRGIAMVFQSYALYPHMTLHENMAFGLKLAGKSRSEIETAVEAAADLLDIRHLLDRKPKTLSGGQRQRVAIGRAIVRQPSVFLFDEPLSNLDAALRVRMRYEFAGLHKRLKTTTIYVTHDQVEAMTLADRIAILDCGEIHQLGTAEELYQRPASRFVAGFVGSPQMNFVEAKLDRGGNDRAAVKLRNAALIEAAVNVGSHSVGEAVALGIRPEHLVRVDQGGLPATVALIEWLGNMQFAYVTTDVSDEPLIMQLPAGQKLDEGQAIQIGARPEDCHLFDSDGHAFPRAAHSPDSMAA